MDATHLSPQAHQRLQEELEERTTTKRKEISEWLERAREHGDIRENADYDAAKNEQGHNEARVRQIEAILKQAVVVEGPTGEKVQAGTLVEVRMEGDDETTTYLIGSIEERGGGFDVISPGSPLGKALLGHSPGDVVTYHAPGGKFDVEIVTVRSPD
jgi:transcription elongation factor GreA